MNKFGSPVGVIREPAPAGRDTDCGPAEVLSDESTAGGSMDFDFSFAFQPIVDAATREIVAFEALVRGPEGQPSAEVFAKVSPEKLHQFDQACRLKAIHLATQLKVWTRLNVNLFPNSIHRTGMNINATLQASIQAGFPVKDLVFEVSEAEKVAHYTPVVEIFKAYKDLGFQTAIDDFGTGYSGLRMLAEYQPNYIKLDRNLIADVHANRVKQSIVQGIGSICRPLEIELIAEGVEKAEEYAWLRKVGIHLFQGYYFARPAFEALAEVRPALFN
jgi:EAL domain-containing protein (putative c-di-GMP-specific phosphodiesterase class I)